MQLSMVRSFAALIPLVLVPTLASVTASAAPPSARRHKPARTARVEKPADKPCAKDTVEVVAGAESATFALTRCDGTAAPTAVEQLSILARPSSAAKPKQPLAVLAKGRGPDVAPGIRRIDARLVERLELVVDHFRKPGEAARVLLVSGYRPRSAGSYHASGRALDLRVDGVTNEALVAFCKTLPDTGCGYYPNSAFVHIDVREAGAGHVSWIDISRPGEAPKYVTAWPLPSDAPGDGKLPPLPGSKDDGGAISTAHTF
jgi:hypothetical protein